jgi:hypothetical protein
VIIAAPPALGVLAFFVLRNVKTPLIARTDP